MDDSKKEGKYKTQSENQALSNVLGTAKPLPRFDFKRLI